MNTGCTSPPLFDSAVVVVVGTGCILLRLLGSAVAVVVGMGCTLLDSTVVVRSS